MLAAKMMMTTFPGVRRRLAGYRELLRGLEGPLPIQALASIRDKEFHCLGGSVYALLAPEKHQEPLLDFIVAYQTISDYLDNLCDRAGVRDEAVFRTLHRSLVDCFSGELSRDYYAGYPYQEDGGYLTGLVKTCQGALAVINPNPKILEDMVSLCQLYIQLQSLKHLELKCGEEALAKLYQEHRTTAPNLFWWEFAAACGSTLGIFALAAGGDSRMRLNKAYMPWISGLHILLDYYIDQDEDRRHGDMNLVSYYNSEREALERLLLFYKKADRVASALSAASHHSYIVDGLIAMYLSDPKAFSPELKKGTELLLREASFRARFLTSLAKKLRKLGKL
jgi:tetraprenyl-beta-curcumene synthase